MNRIAIASLAVVLVLAGAPALAQEAAQSSPAVAAAPASGDAKLAAVRERAHRTRVEDKDGLQKQIESSARDLDTEAATKGDVTIASRLATKFGTTADAFLAERSRFNTGWGALLIAHTLVANSKTDLTIDQVFQLRTEGMGWGQIAGGLDLTLGRVASAMRSQGRSDAAAAKSTGKAARAIEGGAHSSAGPRAGMSASHAKDGSGSASGASISRGRGGK